MKKNDVVNAIARVVAFAKKQEFRVSIYDAKTFTSIQTVVPTADLKLLDTEWQITLELSAPVEVS